MKSKALEVNLSDTRIDIDIDPDYGVLQEIASGYFGVLKRMNAYLRELSHPLKNWAFIVDETRHFSLHYFYLYKDHEKGHQAFERFINILLCAFDSIKQEKIKQDACGNLMRLMHQVLKEDSTNRVRFARIVNQTFDTIVSLGTPDFYYFVRCYYQPKPVSQLLSLMGPADELDLTPTNLFLEKYYQHTFAYFLEEKNAQEWMDEDKAAQQHHTLMRSILQPVSRDMLAQIHDNLDRALKVHPKNSCALTADLLDIPGYMDLVNRFKIIPKKIIDQIPDEALGKHLKLMFLFYMIHVPGLSMVHEETLREINRTLTYLIGNQNFKHDLNMIDRTFGLLKGHTGTFPGTVLDCIHRVGEAVYNIREVELINYFIDHVINTGFQFPTIIGTGEDWQIKGNNAHVKNIRIFLDLVGKNPKLSRRLISALIISLSLGGVHIKDTDLFPRDMTKLLNANIEPVFNLIKQLARRLPIFFNEIGAEGQLRDISTQLDETCRRQDRLVHFLRKQTHVESSSRVVEFTERLLTFWKTGDKNLLKAFVPPSLFEWIQSDGEYVDGLRTILLEIETQGFIEPRDYLMISKNAISRYAEQVEGVSRKDQTRIKLAIELYQLLNQKYNFDNIELKHYLAQPGHDPILETDRLWDALNERDIKKKISLLLDVANSLKSIILSSAVYDVKEFIYNKRHFAVDIPSMYGSYHEAKFDALGLTLRIDNLINVFFEELTGNTDLYLITKATFEEILTILELFAKALKTDGIFSNKMELQLEFLRYSIQIKECSFTQYMDIFRGFSAAVRDMINDHFNNIHTANFFQIGAQIRKEQVLKRFYSNENFEDRQKFIQRASEIFFRDCIVTSLGLQQLDVFLNRILGTLFRQSEELTQSDLNKLLNFDPQNAVAPIDGSLSIGSNIIFLGNKGLNLIKMRRLGLPVPHGFIITTEVFRCLDIIDKYPPAAKNFKRHVGEKLADLEKMTGKTFGDATNPLLLSVRSGSSISQPGMMDSFLNVGINEEIASSLARSTDNAWFAWDSYRRFLQGYGMAFNLARDEFDHLMNSCKQRFSRQFKKDFTGEEMKSTALVYQTFILDHGIEIKTSPMDQLYLAINKVFDSWHSSRARNYRRIMGISDDWGTAVTIQEMIFGNRSDMSGSGVVFSHSPKLPGDTIRLWGDFTIGNQGEDVVSGLVKTIAISEMQRELEDRETHSSLELAFPDIYNRLKAIMNTLVYDEGWNPQEIEFTFEGPNATDLHLLQARDMALRDRPVIQSFDQSYDTLDRRYLSRGIGVSGGPMSGRIVFTLEEIQMYRKADAGTPLIILREDTVPDDILEIDAADGILTARGGVTSHAAIVAYSLGKTCVVGCKHLVCNEKEKTCMLNGRQLTSGDYISINGQEGSVYKGQMELTRLT